jgi:DNA-binding MarR family transcriptional regulator
MQNFEVEVTSLPFYLYRCAMGFRNNLNRSLARAFGEELTVDFWFVLSILFEEDSIPQSLLAQKVSRDRASLSRTLDEMERFGFVKRLSDPSGKRKSIVALTRKSIVLKEQLAKTVNEQTNRLLTDLSPIEVKELIRMLNCTYDRIRKNE